MGKVRKINDEIMEEVGRLTEANKKLEGDLASLPQKKLELDEERKERERLEKELEEVRQRLESEERKQREHNKKSDYQGDMLEKMNQMMMMMNQMKVKQDDIQDAILTNSAAMRKYMDRSTDSIIRAIFDVSEVQCPASFIMLPFKLESLSRDEEDSKLKAWLGALGDMSTALQGGWATVQAEERRIDKGLLSVFRKRAGDFLEQYRKKKTYLYLLDEVTGDVMHGDNYPITITAVKDAVKKFLPLMQVGIYAMYAFNVGAGAAKLCGIPMVSIPDSLRSSAERCAGEMSKKSSVEEYDVLQSHLDLLDAGDEGRQKPPEKREIRGPELRQFQQFLGEKDRERGYCGLSKVCDAETSKVVWTTAEGKAILKERAKHLSSKEYGEKHVFRGTKVMDLS